MSDITPAHVAEFLAGARDYFEDVAQPYTRVDGNSVHVKVVPDNGEAATIFRALVVEVPVYAVAAAPVTLPAETARQLAYGYAGDDIDDWTVVVNEYTGRTRWSSTHHLVIRNEAGEHFADTYRRGLSESQETRPYEDVSTATFTPVVPEIKVATEWVTPKAAQAEQGGAS
ncbi:hypothetical protein ABZ917_17845 [Nonomuraea wenchangensis]